MVIVAGAEMDILPEAIGIASYHEQRFAVRFQSDHAIDNVRACFFQLTSPANIGSFIKARAQFDQSGDLLAVVGLDQRQIGRAHVLTPVTFRSRMPSSA